MTLSEIKNKIKATIDQFYCFPNRKYVEENQLQFIGGVLQTALHLLPFDDYNELKMYIYTEHGYDAGGCTDGQISFDDMEVDDGQE